MTYDLPYELYLWKVNNKFRINTCNTKGSGLKKQNNFINLFFLFKANIKDHKLFLHSIVFCFRKQKQNPTLKKSFPLQQLDRVASASIKRKNLSNKFCAKKEYRPKHTQTYCVATLRQTPMDNTLGKIPW